VAEQVQVMESDIDVARRALEHRELEIEHRRYGLALPARGAEFGPDEMLLNWQIEAQRYSDEITALAQAQAADIVGEAHEHAARTRNEIPAASPPHMTAELAYLRHRIAQLHAWVASLRREVDATDDALAAERNQHPPPNGPTGVER
jgi:hypothetical protein